MAACLSHSSVSPHSVGGLLSLRSRDQKLNIKGNSNSVPTEAAPSRHRPCLVVHDDDSNNNNNASCLHSVCVSSAPKLRTPLSSSSSYSSSLRRTSRIGSRFSRHAVSPRMQVVSEDEISTFIKDVAKIQVPEYLPTLINILQAKGEIRVSPSDRKGIIPLCIPLTKNTQNECITALLRWPTAPEGMEVPVVSVNKYGATLLAKSVNLYIHKLLAEEDFKVGQNDSDEKNLQNRPLAHSGGVLASQIYSQGTIFESGFNNINLYLMRKVGYFPDVLETLALGHLERGDDVSALIAGEFYSTRKHFPGFAHPYVFNTRLLLKTGRENEAKDFAKIAMKNPWWTLGASYQEISELAECGETLLEYAKEKISDEGRQEDLTKGKILEQIALDQAAFLLDICSAENSWDQRRNELANFYDEAQLTDFANFIRFGI